MNDDSDSTADPADPWVITGVSQVTGTRAEQEAGRRGMTLARWLEEAIEHALLAEKSAPPPPPPDPAD